MGFFQKLKARLFSLETPAQKPKVEAAIKKPVITKKDKETKLAKPAPIENKKAIKALAKATAKNAKQEAKEKAEVAKQVNKVEKYVVGLSRPADAFRRAIEEVQARHVKLDEAFFTDLEEALIMSDISLKLVTELIEEIKREVRIAKLDSPKQIAEVIADKMFTLYANKDIVDTRLNVEPGRLNVILVVGVNGVGKTTTIAKLANRYVKENLRVFIAAGDTFRAGAVAQLDVWAKRVGAVLIKNEAANADPASVVFDAVNAAKKANADLLIVDTAGRLQNKVNLMNELAKINKILTREIPDAPHESLLVLDATTGQNGVLQAAAFREVTPLTGIVLTKLDGTSKGGIILTIRDELGLAVKLVGLGESMEDLQDFDLTLLFTALLKTWKQVLMEISEREALGQLFDRYSKLLTQTQRQAVALFLIEDVSVSEIAKIMATTRQAASYNVKSGLAKLTRIAKQIE